ncbi:sensor histidine kinase [Nonomuraea fuscirosea]|uniref:sensor histidine kinase n=1 Tax=Nonomuraea fuscirosea TaxID=1291556 RepID=UPI0033EDE61D
MPAPHRSTVTRPPREPGVAAPLPRRTHPAARLLRDTHPAGRLLRDAGLAVGLAVAGVVILPYLPHAALVVAMCVPLVLRRACPWAALVTVTVAAALHVVVLQDPTVSVVAVPVVVHSLARWSTTTAARAALAVGLAGAVIGPARWLSVQLEAPSLGSWVTSIVGHGAVVVAAFVVGRRAREREELLVRQERERAERQRSALAERERAIRRAADDERHEVAREIHDLVAHSLAVIAVQAEGGRAMVARHPHRAQEILTVIADASREALDELRQVVAMLRRHEPGPAADYRPAVGLDDVADLVARLGGRARLRVQGDPGAVSPLAGVTVYRIVQESLTNVLRHAGPAARAQVAITVTGHEVTVRVRDDGRGAAAESDGRSRAVEPEGRGDAVEPDGRGTGLVAMRERVQLHDGTLTAGPCAGGGFEVHAVLPAHRATGAAAG